MIEQGLYYATTDFQKMIQSVGGTWNDTKHRPIVCLVKSAENERLYWAIPMGKLNHRDTSQKKRLNFYLNFRNGTSVPAIITSAGQHHNPFFSSVMQYPLLINT